MFTVLRGLWFLQDIAEISALGANSEVIEHDIALTILELSPLGLRVLGLLDGLKVLVATGTLHGQKHVNHHEFYTRLL